MHGIRFTPEARRALGGIPDKVRPAIFEAIDGIIAVNPHRAGKGLRLQLEGLYAARRGEYRIVYAIDDDAEIVTIHRVEHRRGHSCWSDAIAAHDYCHLLPPVPDGDVGDLLGAEQPPWSSWTIAS